MFEHLKWLNGKGMTNKETTHDSKAPLFLQLLSVLDDRIDIQSDMEVEVDGVSLHVVIQDEVALISFSRWGDLVTFMRTMKKLHGLDRGAFGHLNNLLSRLGLTLYLNNRFFALAGPKAGIILPAIVKMGIPSPKGN